MREYLLNKPQPSNEKKKGDIEDPWTPGGTQSGPKNSLAGAPRATYMAEEQGVQEVQNQEEEIEAEELAQARNGCTYNAIWYSLYLTTWIGRTFEVAFAMFMFQSVNDFLFGTSEYGSAQPGIFGSSVPMLIQYLSYIATIPLVAGGLFSDIMTVDPDASARRGADFLCYHAKKHISGMLRPFLYINLLAVFTVGAFGQFAGTDAILDLIHKDFSNTHGGQAVKYFLYGLAYIGTVGYYTAMYSVPVTDLAKRANKTLSMQNRDWNIWDRAARVNSAINLFGWTKDVGTFTFIKAAIFAFLTIKFFTDLNADRNAHGVAPIGNDVVTAMTCITIAFTAFANIYLTALENKDLVIPKKPQNFANFKVNVDKRPDGCITKSKDALITAIAGLGVIGTYAFFNKFQTDATSLTAYGALAIVGAVVSAATYRHQTNKAALAPSNEYDEIAKLLVSINKAFPGYSAAPNFAQIPEKYVKGTAGRIWKLRAKLASFDKLVNEDREGYRGVRNSEEAGNHRATIEQARAIVTDFNKTYDQLSARSMLQKLVDKMYGYGPVCTTILRAMALPHFVATVCDKLELGPEYDDEYTTLLSRVALASVFAIPYTVANYILYTNRVGENTPTPKVWNEPATQYCGSVKRCFTSIFNRGGNQNVAVEMDRDGQPVDAANYENLEGGQQRRSWLLCC